ncbi:dimethylarginine dimethylaminohydrolase family protein [Paenisporosarcina indica]|uniref:dimethylarginine dimethylaminohydrolase family protein n=1 Tax=Paenisporosarcina indica TaxID=650093 RepID=UPI00094F8E26|nr:arginine deiminase family protein [Paenisporosarcina indica]
MNQESIDVFETSCHSEYDILRKVIVCEPQFMSIDEVINDCQKQFIDQNINVDRALNQHQEFVEKMRSQGIEVISLSANETYPEQVFTRDIGFTLGNQTFVAEMASSIRRGEETILEKWLDTHHLPFEKLSEHYIEGGDVIIDGNTIFVGLGDRTSKHAISHLQTDLPDYELIQIPFDPKYLHLDCIFNILSPTDALIFPQALSAETVKMLATRYHLIEVSPEEQFTMGTNVLSIGNKKVFSLPMNKNINEKMRAEGYEIIEVDFSEIIKSGGSFRCCTMPIERG